MSTVTLTFFLLVSAWLTVLGWYDCSRRILPNWLTCSGAMFFLMINFLLGGPQLGMNCLVGGIVGLMFLLIPYLGHFAGGGDVKMLMAVGCLVGYPSILHVLFLMCIFGFFIAVFMMLRCLNKAWLVHIFKSCFCFHYDREAGRKALPPKKLHSIPLGPAISLATWLIMALRIYNDATNN